MKRQKNKHGFALVGIFCASLAITSPVSSDYDPSYRECAQLPGPAMVIDCIHMKNLLRDKEVQQIFSQPIQKDKVFFDNKTIKFHNDNE